MRNSRNTADAGMTWPAAVLATAMVVPALVGPRAAPAQSTPDTADVEQARRLVEQGAHDTASAVLAEYLEEHPSHARVRWLRARSLFWQGRHAAALREYERAVEALPEEPTLRVDYGQVLAATGRRERARRILEPVPQRARNAGQPATEADARTLLGKLAYWSNDYGSARAHLERVLEIDPDRQEARRILTELQRMTAPWLAVGGEYQDDSQPLRGRSLNLEAGVPLSSRVTLSLSAAPHQLTGDGGTWRDVRAESGALRVDWPGPLETRLEAGRIRHVAADRAGWTGEGELSARLGGGFSLSATAERWNYRHTSGVLDTALFVESASARLRRDRPTGWGGRLGARVDRFPDGNRIRHGQLWVLAPLWSEGDDAVRLGYAFRATDAERSTFQPASASPSGSDATLSHRPGPPVGGDPSGGGRTAADGTYRPYYTPEDVRSHSAVAALRVRAGSDVTLSADGAVGIHATEQVPAAGSSGGTMTYIERDFRPWRLRGRMRVEPGRRTGLELEAGYREDAFYQIFEASVRWTYRFLGALPGG